MLWKYLGPTGCWSCQLINRNMLNCTVFHCSPITVVAWIHLCLTPPTWDRNYFTDEKTQAHRLNSFTVVIQQKSRTDTQIHILLTSFGVFTLLGFNINISPDSLYDCQEPRNKRITLWERSNSAHEMTLLVESELVASRRHHIQADVPVPTLPLIHVPTGLWKLEKSHKCPGGQAEAKLPRAAPPPIRSQARHPWGGIELSFWVMRVLGIKAVASLG